MSNKQKINVVLLMSYLLLDFILLSVAFADTKFQVVKDQYVIKRKANFAQRGVMRFKSTQRFSDFEVLTKSTRGIRASSRKVIVNYRANKDRCALMMQADPSIESCMPNYVLKKAVISNDPQFSNQWGHQQSSNIDIDSP